MPDLETLLGWRGRTVVDRDGERIGKLGDLYLDESTDLPAYASVRTGLLGRKESVVPLEGIEEREGDLVVPHPGDLVRDAPSIDPDESLDDAEQERLARHYRGQRDRSADVVAAAPDHADTDAEASADVEMVRSEEEVVTGTSPMQPTERVRLRKFLVTDEVTRTVPVRREEIRLETDPPPEGQIERVEDVDEQR
jgi:hypothetical protein